MRPPRIPTLALALALAAVAAGCSKKAEQIVGNERLLRGPGGLGTTARSAAPLERDAYIQSGAANLGATLLAGEEGAYQARTLLTVGTWALPDTNDQSLAVTSIALLLSFDGALDIPNDANDSLGVWTASAPWDTTNIAWPGPGLGSFLAGARPGAAIGDFSVELGAGLFPTVRFWAENPSILPGLVVAAATGQGVAGFRAGTGRIRIRYTVTVSGSPQADSVDTPIASDLFLHSPLTPAPVGNETTLILGGFYETAVAMRAPVDSFVPGFSVDEAGFVFRIASGSPAFSDSVDVDAYRIRNAWTEGVTDTASLGADPGVLVKVRAFRIRTVADSLLVVPIPRSLARECSENPASNEGLLLRIRESFRAPQILLMSRESASPPELRVSTTSPPPGRF